MIRLVLISLLLMLTVGSLVSAQTVTPISTPAPWPPDPNAIFAEGVEWSLYEDISEEPISIDNAKRVIRVLNANGSSHEYPFPEGSFSLYKAVAQSNGLIRVYRSDEGEWVGNVLLLNPETGLYEDIPTSCRGQALQDELGQGRWTVIQLDSVEYDESVLCHTETSEERNTLPNETRFWWSAHSTPDSNRLILSAYNLVDYQIFVYDLSSDQITKLGVIDRGIDDEVYLCDWITDTMGVYCARGTHYDEGTGYYGFDISKPDSLYRLFGGSNTDTFKLEDPVRYIHVSDYEYDGYTAGGYGEQRPCTLSIYDANGLQEVELGEQCLPIPRSTVYEDISPYHRQDNHLYFLVIDDEDATVTWLTHYAINENKVSKIAYPMEMESILSVSPDHRYVAVLMDDNGVLDFPWQSCCHETHGRQIAIMDANYEHIIYQSEPLGVFVPMQVMWTSNTTVSIAAVEHYTKTYRPDGMVETFIQPASSHLIHLEGKFVIATSTTQYEGLPLDVSPNLLYGLDNENTVIHLRSFQSLTFLHDNVLEDYTVFAEWHTDSRLKVEISLSYNQRVTYLLTLP